MAQQGGKLYGRGLIVRRVKKELKRDGVPERPLSIILLVGPHGSGGTALLRHLWDACAADSPTAHLDLASAQGTDDVVLAAMQGLRRRILGIRTIGFPRLGLALKALSFDDDGDGRPAFEKYLQDGSRRASRRSTLNTWANRATTLVTSVDQKIVVMVTAKLLDTMYSGVERHRDSQILKWYALNGISSGGDKYDPLWQLYRWRHEGTKDASRKVDKTLCAAFLADLRTDFNEAGMRHGQRTSNCLLLIDNAGGKAGQHFLELLDECRRESRLADESPDPLVVVAAQRGKPRALAGVPVEATDDRLKEAPADDGSWPNWWCPVRLTDLVPSDVLKVTTSTVLGSTRRDADLLHALTGGHPDATTRLATLLSVFGSGPFDPRLLLDTELPDGHRLPDHWPVDESRTSVEDFLLKRAFPDDLVTRKDGSIDASGSPMLNAMAVCAATPGLRLGACRDVLGFLGWTQVSAKDVRNRLADTLWLDDTSGLHPLARLLLRRWLARDPGVWRDTHQAYVNHYARNTDEAVLAHHHRLALAEPGHMEEQLAAVVGYLEKEFERSSAPEWLRVLETITDAPNRLRDEHPPEIFVTAQAGAESPGDRRRIIARLTVALWLSKDRCFDPGRRLTKLIAGEHGYLTGLDRPDGEVFLTESNRYGGIWEEWKD